MAHAPDNGSINPCPLTWQSATHILTPRHMRDMRHPCIYMCVCQFANCPTMGAVRRGTCSNCPKNNEHIVCSDSRNARIAEPPSSSMIRNGSLGASARAHTHTHTMESKNYHWQELIAMKNTSMAISQKFGGGFYWGWGGGSEGHRGGRWGGGGKQLGMHTLMDGTSRTLVKGGGRTKMHVEGHLERFRPHCSREMPP